MGKRKTHQTKEQSNIRDVKEETFECNEDSAEMEGVSESGSDGESVSKQRHYLDEDEESDSAPEDISFAEGKKEALESVSQALRQIQENRKQLKEKRRKHHERLRVQKQQKVEKLQQKKLSAEFLEEVSKRSFQTSTLEEQKFPKVKEREKSKHEHFDEDEEGADDTGYVPLVLDDRFQVVTASEAEKQPHPTPPNAKDFLQQTLYGKHVRRKRVADIKSVAAKKHFQPATNFACPKRPRRRRGKWNKKKET